MSDPEWNSFTKALDEVATSKNSSSPRQFLSLEAEVDDDSGGSGQEQSSGSDTNSFIVSNDSDEEIPERY